MVISSSKPALSSSKAVIKNNFTLSTRIFHQSRLLNNTPNYEMPVEVNMSEAHINKWNLTTVSANTHIYDGTIFKVIISFAALSVVFIILCCFGKAICTCCRRFKRRVIDKMEIFKSKNGSKADGSSD